MLIMTIWHVVVIRLKIKMLVAALLVVVRLVVMLHL